MAEVELGNLVVHDLAGVGDGAGDLVDDIPELAVTTGLTTSGVLGLSRVVARVRRGEVLGLHAVVGVASGVLAGRGVVEVGVDVFADVADASREAVVLEVLAEGTKGGSGDTGTLSRAVGAVVLLDNLEVGVLESRPAQTVTELVDGSLVAGTGLARVLLVEVAVVEEGALGVGILRSILAVVGSVDDAVAVALSGGTPGEGGAARASLAVENVNERVTRLLARLTSPDNGGNVGVVVPVLDEDSASGVENNDNVGVDRGNSLDEVIAVLPESQVLAVTSVAVDVDVAFTTVGVGKDDGSAVGLANEVLGSLGLVVAEDALVASAILDSLVLDSGVGGDEVGEVGSTRTPLHGESAVVAAAVVAAVGALGVGTSILTNDSDELGLVEGQDAVVLEDDGSLGSRLADVVGVVAANVNSKVDLLIVFIDAGNAEAVRVARPGREASLNLVLNGLADLEVSSHDTHGHIVNTVLGNGAIDDSNSQVGTPVAETGVEDGVTRHGHIETGESSADTRVLGLPIAHDEALEAVLVLEETVESLGVAAAVGVVDLLVRAHDGANASLNGILEGPSVVLVHELVVDVGGEGGKTVLGLTEMLWKPQNVSKIAADEGECVVHNLPCSLPM